MRGIYSSYKGGSAAGQAQVALPPGTGALHLIRARERKGEESGTSAGGLCALAPRDGRLRTNAKGPCQRCLLGAVLRSFWS